MAQRDRDPDEAAQIESAGESSEAEKGAGDQAEKVAEPALMVQREQQEQKSPQIAEGDTQAEGDPNSEEDAIARRENPEGEAALAEGFQDQRGAQGQAGTYPQSDPKQVAAANKAMSEEFQDQRGAQGSAGSLPEHESER